MKEIEYRKIMSQLRSAIAGGQYKEGQRLASEAALTQSSASMTRRLATVALHAMLERLSNPSLPPWHLTLAGDLVVRQFCGSLIRPTT